MLDEDRIVHVVELYARHHYIVEAPHGAWEVINSTLCDLVVGEDIPMRQCARWRAVTCLFCRAKIA